MDDKKNKTNAIRILDQKRVSYQQHSYDTSYISAKEVAGYLSQDEARLFKTLVTTGRSGQYYVFMVPGEKQLDLKKAAGAAGEKSLEMIPQKDLQPLTGYVHGGCSPIGMKKQFKTFIDVTAVDFDTIFFSGGRIGTQIEMGLSELKQVVKVNLSDITKP